MESSNLFSGSKSSTYIGRQTRGQSLFLSEISPSCNEPSLVGLKGNEGSQGASHHHSPRWVSDFFTEEQPFWLDDLLNEPDTQLMNRSHRRSASDTFAYLGEAIEELDIREDTIQKDVVITTSSFLKNGVHYNNDSSQFKFEIKTSSQDEKFKKDSDVAVLTRSAEKRDKDVVNSRNSEGSVGGSTSSSPPKHPKTDAKCAKQQSAHRSRVRKLQYIHQLERTIQIMQTKGSEISAELEFLDHQNLILSMENKALKQRLDSLSQEQLIKQMEQGMLERELGRLQNLYQIQREQHIQVLLQPKNRRNKNKDLQSQLANISKMNIRGTI